MLDKDGNIDLENWPDCAVKGCKHKSCLRLKSIYCYPHTLGGFDTATANAEVETYTEIKEEERIGGIDG